MKLSKYLSSILSGMFVILGLTGAFLVSRNSEKPLLFITKQQSSLNINDSFFRFFNLGQKRLYSSILWTATILESDNDHYNGKDLNSWMFLRFMTISKLEPLFLPTYTFGGPYLSIIKDDLDGASVIYDKGLSLYPEDFDLLNSAAFHYQFEKVDYEKSYKIYKKLNTFSNVSASHVSQYARLESENGNLQNAYALLMNLYKKVDGRNDFLKEKVGNFLYSIKAELDLSCLNSKALGCSKVDFENQTYIEKNGSYVARKSWTPYRPKTKKPL